MKYLHETFKEELSGESNLFVKDGQVFIRFRTWTAAEIVELARNVDGKNEVFEELFTDWLDERVERRLDEAEEILEKHDQKNRFRRLEEAYAEGSVLPFIGAGLSMPSGYPSWTAFLRKLRHQTEIPEEDLEQLIQQGDYEQAAQLLANELGVAFNEAVDSTFGCSRELLGPVRLLPYVFSGSVVTTNFDNVLDRCFADAEQAFAERISGADSQLIKRKLTAGERFLMKLHGTATSGRGRILTQREYEMHYSDGNTLQRTVGALCDTHNILFIGCGLSVDRTLTALKAHVNVEGHDNLPKHYAFLPEPETEGERIRRQRDLAECHIYPIWYPRDSHDESIEALLIKLREARKQ